MLGLYCGGMLSRYGVVGCYSYSKGQRGGPILGTAIKGTGDEVCGERKGGEGLSASEWAACGVASIFIYHRGFQPRWTEAFLLIGSGRVNAFTSENVARRLRYFKS